MLRTQSCCPPQLLDDRLSGIIVAEAETDDDLALLARNVIESGTRVLCGAAGFARQLARALPAPAASSAPVTGERHSGPVLVVAGSRHEATRRQLEALRTSGITVINLTQELIDDPAAPVTPVVAAVADALRGGDVVALTSGELTDCVLGRGHVAGLLVRITAAPAVRASLGGLVATGGDVAAAVCHALDIAALRIGGEIAPGLPWSVAEGGLAPGLLIGTKAGSFGDSRALLTCAARLRSMMPGSR